MNGWSRIGDLIYLVLQIIVRLALLGGFIAIIVLALFLFLGLTQ